MRTPEDQLPPQYLAWLASLPRLHVVTFKKSNWEFSTIEELNCPIRVNKSKATFATQLSGFVDMYKEMGATSADGPKKTEFGFDQLVRSIVLAEDNEVLLFVDPEDTFSLWKLEPEDCSVRHVARDIFAFIDGSSVEGLLRTIPGW